jgi:hypothetical protein
MIFDHFKNKFKVKTDFLEYHGVINAVKTLCQKILPDEKVPTSPFRPIRMQILMSTSKGCESIYNALQKKNTNKTKSGQKWEQKLDMENYLHYLFH